MKKIPIQPYTKGLIRDILGISSTELGRRLKELEPELIEKFPKYNKHSKILPGTIFIWICDQFEERDTIIARLMNHFDIEEPSDMDKFRRCYGLTTPNTPHLQPKKNHISPKLP